MNHAESGRATDFFNSLLGLLADTSISGVRVARELDAIIARRAKPATVVSDNGTELTSNAILKWADGTKVGWHYIAPGKPQAERLHRELQRASQRRVAKRDPVPLAAECLEAWRRDYNEHRQHSKLGWMNKSGHVTAASCCGIDQHAGTATVGAREVLSECLRGLRWIKARPVARGNYQPMALLLVRRLVLLTAIKLIAFVVIYFLLFAPAAKPPLDVAGHIAGLTIHP